MPSGHSSSSHSSFSSSSASLGHSFSPSYHSSSSHSSYSSGYESSSRSSASHRPSTPTVVDREAEALRHRTSYRDAHEHDVNLINSMLWYYFIFNNNRRIRYYNEDYTDKQGMRYSQGYYDEESGKRYDNVIMRGAENVVKCPYCNERFLHKWSYDEGTQSVECPYCNKDIEVMDEIDEDFVKRSDKMTPEAKKKKVKDTIIEGLYTFVDSIPVIIAVIIGIGIFAFTMFLTSTPMSEWFPETDSTKVITTNNGALPSVIYVEPLGRECQYDGENYYDAQTDSYFWFNTNVSPAQWQYWFEGISNEYGDYGWMEYDDNEQQWYVETYSGNWVKFQGDTSRMWHFDDAYQDPETMTNTTAAVASDESGAMTTIQDTVNFTGLVPGNTYIVTVKVVDPNTDTVVNVQRASFVPETADGGAVVTVSVPNDGGTYTLAESIFQ